MRRLCLRALSACVSVSISVCVCVCVCVCVSVCSEICTFNTEYTQEKVTPLLPWALLLA